MDQIEQISNKSKYKYKIEWKTSLRTIDYTQVIAQFNKTLVYKKLKL